MIIVNGQEGHIQITMVASRQDSNAEVTSAEVTSAKSPLPTHSARGGDNETGMRSERSIQKGPFGI
jgi:hypothetical protein